MLSDLSYINPEYETMPINFQLTSIYDHSLHDAFSRVLHKLIDSLPYLEDLLNVFCAVCVPPIPCIQYSFGDTELASDKGVPF